MRHITQISTARSGQASREMKAVATHEKVSVASIREGIARGEIVIPKNIRHAFAKICGVGRTLRTKVNANIGTSKESSTCAAEIAKMRAAVRLGADAIMDLSTGGNIRRTRQAIIKAATVPVGTVPLYEIIVRAMQRQGTVAQVTVDDMFRVLEEQAEDGVDFFTIHAGIRPHALELLRSRPRLMNIVSRGGAFLAEWMITNKRDNPFYEHFDRVLDIAQRYDITLSLGDGLRPGAIADATDAPQIAELLCLGELQQRALAAGVQSMIEGPGHVPINQIAANVALEKAICHGAPFYVLGPLVTDVAPGYDHITAAIGGAVAGSAGADFLCYVTPSEHVRLPTVDDVKEGVVATRIAAHAADIAKGVAGARDWDVALSRQRAARRWKKQFALALDPERPAVFRAASRPDRSDVCTMCSNYCSIRVAERCFAAADATHVKG